MCVAVIERKIVQDKLEAGEALENISGDPSA